LELKTTGLINEILIIGNFSILISANVFARDTNSMRTTTEAIFIGDTEEMLISKMGKAKPRYFVYEDGNFVCATTEYKYDIDMQSTKYICVEAKFLKLM
jgi:hypothetical protein